MATAASSASLLLLSGAGPHPLPPMAASLLSFGPALGVALPLGFLLLSSVLPVLKVLIIAGTGLVLALPSVNVLNAASRKSLSKLVFTIFLPAIIFVNLGESINVQKLVAWWFIPVNVILASVIGCLMGVVVGKVTNAPPEFSRIIFVLTGIGNMGNMPLVLLSAVCSDSRNPFGDTLQCDKMGTAYISLGMWMAAIIMWGFVYNVVAPPQEWLPGYEPLPEHSQDHSSHRGKEQSHSHPPPIPENQVENGTPEPYGARVGLSAHPLLQATSGSFRKASETILIAHSKFNYWMETLHIYDILRPPVLAAFTAMLMGMVPILDFIMFDPNGPLRFLTDSIGIMGQAMIACILLVLGGNLVGGPGSSELPTSTTVLVVITRLLVVPSIGICIVLTADHLGWLPPDDPMFRFVLFLQHTMPSSIQLGTACSLRGFGEKEVSAVLFYQHLACVVSIAFFLFLHFYILFGV